MDSAAKHPYVSSVAELGERWVSAHRVARIGLGGLTPLRSPGLLRAGDVSRLFVIPAIMPLNL